MSKISEKNDDGYWQWSHQIRISFEIVDNLLSLESFDAGILFRNIRVSKMINFVNFDLDLHFQGNLL